METVIYHLVEAKNKNAAQRAKRFSQEIVMDNQCTIEYLEIGRLFATAPALDATTIFSHLPITWRNFPFFVTLRALNADKELVQVVERSGLTRAARVEKGARLPKVLLLNTYSLFDRVISN